MPVVIADIANPDGCQLPDIVVINLGHGYIELVTHPAGNRLQDLSLALEGRVLRQAKADSAYANIHCQYGC